MITFAAGVFVVLWAMESAALYRKSGDWGLSVLIGGAMAGGWVGLTLVATRVLLEI